jgi:hypothetical protein
MAESEKTPAANQSRKTASDYTVTPAISQKSKWIG